MDENVQNSMTFQNFPKKPIFRQNGTYNYTALTRRLERQAGVFPCILNLLTVLQILN